MKTEGEGINVMRDVVHVTIYGPKRLFWSILLVGCDFISLLYFKIRYNFLDPKTGGYYSSTKVQSNTKNGNASR